MGKIKWDEQTSSQSDEEPVWTGKKDSKNGRRIEINFNLGPLTLLSLCAVYSDLTAMGLGKKMKILRLFNNTKFKYSQFVSRRLNYNFNSPLSLSAQLNHAKISKGTDEEEFCVLNWWTCERSTRILKSGRLKRFFRHFQASFAAPQNEYCDHNSSGKHSGSSIREFRKCFKVLQ